MNSPNHPQTSSSPHGDRSVQDAGVTVEWLYGDRIVVFRLTDVSRKTVDAWSRLVLSEIAKVPVDQPLLFMHDVSAPGVGPTPTLATKVPGLHHAASHLKGRVAIVMAESIYGQLVSGFLHSRYMGSARQVNRGFTSYEEALIWLAELLPDPAVDAGS